MAARKTAARMIEKTVFIKNPFQESLDLGFRRGDGFVEFCKWLFRSGDFRFGEALFHAKTRRPRRKSKI
jgi:hypothetical protein